MDKCKPLLGGINDSPDHARELGHLLYTKHLAGAYTRPLFSPT